jgi:hypothetical protein
MRADQAARQPIGLTSFDPNGYEELRDNPAATLPAIGVVVGATILAALGGLLWAALAAAPPPIFNVDIQHFLVASVLIGSLLQVVLWVAWVVLAYVFLRTIYLIEGVQFTGLVRTMGFAFAPMGLQIFLVFPVLEFPIGLIAIGLTFGCTVLAVRAASGATPAQALVSAGAGFVLFAMALGLLGNSDADLAPGIWALDPNAISIRLELNPDSGR